MKKMKMKKFLLVLMFSVVLCATGFTGKSYAEVTGWVDTDGDGANEYASAGYFGDPRISIADGGQTRYYYVASDWTAVVGTDTNGVAGTDLVFTYSKTTLNYGNAGYYDAAVSIVHDQSGTVRNYYLTFKDKGYDVTGHPIYYTYDYYYVTNLDGQPGDEIVFHYPAYVNRTNYSIEEPAHYEVVNDRTGTTYWMY